MIVILEGPDGSGKTVLASQLVERYKLKYRHEGPPPPDVSLLDYYGGLLEDARGTNVVFDRLALGELVYGPILRGKDRLGADGYRLIMKLISAVGAQTIVCLPPMKTCEENWSKRLSSELFKDASKFRETYRMYVQLFTTFDEWTYDYTRDPIDAIFALLNLERPTLPANMTGSPKAKYLLLGDRGSSKDPYVDLPFWSTVNSSAYLYRALDMAGFNDFQCAFMNAHFVGHETPRSIPEYFFPEAKNARIIALGERASEVCRRQGMDHCGVPHPQFWRRFHHHDIESYADLLRECR